MKRRLGIRARFLLLLICLFVTVFGAITYVIVQQNTNTLRSNLVIQSKSFADLATKPIGDAFLLYKDGGTIRIKQQVDRFTDLNPNISQVEVVDIDGKQIFTTDEKNPITVSKDAAASLKPLYIYENKNLTTIIQPLVEDFGIHRYAVVYGVSYDSVQRSIQNTIAFILALSIGILLVLLLIAYILIDKLFIQPLDYVSQIALIISKGNLSQQITLKRNDEIGDLANAVNTMADSLKSDIAKLKAVDELKNEFLIITSHNLRTPLTVIKAYVETLEGIEKDEEKQKLIEPIKLSAMRLDGFAEDVLTISTFEAGRNILQPEPTEMKPILEKIATDFEALAKQKQLEFSIDIDTAASVNLSKPHFRSALWNILDNAHKFTEPHGKVTLTAKDHDNQINISVTDTGVGIPADEMPKLFTKFHRANDVMVYNYEGTGIGLYIAKIIIEQHGGTISVESTEGKGSTFTISLPIMT
jgi:signal transduction histidine kinase